MESNSSLDVDDIVSETDFYYSSILSLLKFAPSYGRISTKKIVNQKSFNEFSL